MCATCQQKSYIPRAFENMTYKTSCSIVHWLSHIIYCPSDCLWLDSGQNHPDTPDWPPSTGDAQVIDGGENWA